MQYAPEIMGVMTELLRRIPVVMPGTDDLIDGTVIAVDYRLPAVYIDLSPIGTGIILGREFMNAKETIKVLKPGDSVTAKVLVPENEIGYIELSLKGAKQEIVWREIEEMEKSKAPLELEVLDANKGGLILEWKSIPGFLPTSQLKSAHYPRVEDGDKDRILVELQKLIGEKIPVVVLSYNQTEQKLIFTEKGTKDEELERIVSKYSVGDVIDGEVTGAVDFGVFLRIEEGLEGLVHISELDWSLVEDPTKLHKVGEKVKAKVINVADGKISLSIKALKPDPWHGIEKRYSVGNIVQGVVIRFNKHGALVSIEEGVAGLVHISGFVSDTEMRQKLELGKQYTFQITLFEPESRRLTLTYLDEASKK